MELRAGTRTRSDRVAEFVREREAAIVVIVSFDRAVHA
jgi:hypothetical protein